MRRLVVEETDVHLHGSDDPEAPLLVWIGDALWPGRSASAAERLAGELAARSGWSVASVQWAAGGVDLFPGPLSCAYRCLAQLGERNASGTVAVGGDGFGAGLAAATSILRRRYGDEPVSASVLLAPLLDARLVSPSWERFGGERERQRMDAALAAYAPGLDRGDPLLSPLLAEDLTGLPTTVVVTAGLDPMRDDGERYAERLRAAGVTVHGHRYPDTDHARACGASGGTAVIKGLSSALRLVLSRSTQGREPSSSRRADAPPRHRT